MTSLQLFQLLLVLFTSPSIGKKVHECSHDDIDYHIHETFINYENHPHDQTINMDPMLKDQVNPTRRRGLINAEPQPIRIKPYYEPTQISIDNGLKDEDIEYIKSLISSVIRYYEQFVSIIPVSGNLKFHRECTQWYNTEFGTNCVEYQKPPYCGMVDLPNEHLDEDLLYFNPMNTTRAIKLPSGPGIADTDLVLYVSYGETQSCGPATLAWAQPCFQDQFGRPIAGNINICPYMFKTEHFWKQDMVVLLHETTHITIMGPELWDDFRDSNGNTIPKEYVVSQQQEDGFFYITSPKVKQFARTHFNCDELMGFPLENTGNGGSAGAHWDEHYAMSALMGSTIWGGLHFFSALTFSLMSDSGWYFIDYNFVEPYYFAKNTGCEVFTRECINAETSQSNWPQYWCTSPSDNGCSYNYLAPAFCEYYFLNDELPEWAQYFQDGTHGGPEASDYCPFRDPNTPIHDFEAACWDLRGNTYVQQRFDNEIYAINSRCVDIEDGNGEYNGYCFEHECYGYDEVYQQWDGVIIKIDEKENIDCTRDDQPDGPYMIRKYSITQDVYITCPDVDAICGTTSQPFACIWGNWNDDLSKCVCVAGYIGDQCDIEDREVGPEIILLDNFDSETSAPLKPVSDVLCVRDFSDEFINGEYVYNGQWNFYPLWKNEKNGLYVFWNMFSHWWMIFSEIDTFYYHAYCNVSEWTEDITDCNQYWRIYQPNIDTTVREKYATTHYGSCDQPEMHTTSMPTPLPTSRPTIKPTPQPTSRPTSRPTTESPTSVNIVDFVDVLTGGDKERTSDPTRAQTTKEPSVTIIDFVDDLTEGMEETPNPTSSIRRIESPTHSILQAQLHISNNNINLTEKTTLESTEGTQLLTEAAAEPMNEENDSWHIGKFELELDDYFIILIGIGIVLIVFLILCLLWCACRIMKSLKKFNHYDDVQSQSGGGRHKTHGIRLNEESMEFQSVQA